MYGKAIEIFLVNGSVDGIVTAELTTWNGKAIKLPRTEVASCDREDIEGTGVYFLFCKEEDNSDSVYIGEAENARYRLLIHMNDYNANKETYYWTTAVMFVGTNLNKADIRYMEDKLVELARTTGRYKVLTKNTYKNTKMKESQIAMAKEFIDNIKIIIATLGYRIFEEMPKANSSTKYLYCKGNNGDAKGFSSPGGFTVLKGSRISDHKVNSLKHKFREQLISKGVIVDSVFVKDYEFNSPSGASSTILGRPSNGNEDWKTEDGEKLKNL